MSQRECAGFNWPPLSIAASEPVSSSPDAVSRAGPASVANPGRHDSFPRRSSLFAPSAVREPLFPSDARGVGQPASATVFLELSLFPAALFPFCAGVPAIGVGQPVIAISDMRRTDPRSRERDTPEGVTHAFHVSVYKVDPRLRSLACNLLSKDDWRAALVDKVLPGGP